MQIAMDLYEIISQANPSGSSHYIRTTIRIEC